MDDDDLANGPATDQADEFSAAFAQRAEELRGGKPAQQDASKDETQAAAAGEQDDGNDQSAPAEDAAAAPPKRAEAKKDAEPKVGTTGKSVAELEEELAAALHRERSVANRISANDRRVNELNTENAALKRRISELEAAAKAPAQQAKPAAGKTADDVLANAPDLEAAVQSRIEQATGELRQALDAANARLQELGESTTKTSEALRPMVERDAENAVRQVWKDLDGMFTPQWRKDKNSASFQLWLNQQSRAIQELYQNSVDSKDCAAVLDLYYGTRGGRPKPAAEPNTGANTSANQKPAPVSQDRLRQAAGIATRGSRLEAKPDPNDYDAAFAEAMAARRNRKD